MQENKELRFRKIESRLNSLKYEITPEGFRHYKKVKIARSGLFPWYAQELERDGIKKTFPEMRSNEKVQLMRPSSTFTKEVVDSINGKSFTLDHPRSGLVTLNNIKEEDMGTLFNASFEENALGEDGLLYSDLLVKDKRAFKAIDDGLIEVSIGYIYEKPVKFEKDLHFVAYENIISMNHLALVRSGRAGPMCRLNKKINKTGEKMEEEFEIRLNKMTSVMEATNKNVAALAESMKIQNERQEQIARLNEAKIKAEKKKIRKEREENLKNKETEALAKEEALKAKDEAMKVRENELNEKLTEIDSRKNDIFFNTDEKGTIEGLIKSIPDDQFTAFYEGRMKKGDKGTLNEMMEAEAKIRANKKPNNENGEGNEGGGRANNSGKSNSDNNESIMSNFI